MSHLCETTACHGPEHGLEQLSERQEHLGRDGNGRDRSRFGVSEFCFSNHREGLRMDMLCINNDDE